MTQPTMSEFTSVQLQISLLTVHVLKVTAGEDETVILNGIEVFLNLLSGESKVGLDKHSLDINSSYTNDYWDLIPELNLLAEQDEDGIWQQMIWQIKGNFEILPEMSAQVAAESISWELIFEHEFTEDQIEEPNQYFKVLNAAFI